tara:strand:- start:3087 stop:3962 length:876 start_codon:yes stop_codon:yes gene_type:complete
MKRSRGYIPEEVVFFIRGFRTRMNHRICTAAFPLADRIFDANGKSLANARRWARNYGDPVDKPENVQRISNIPRKGYRVVGAEQRGEGGRAWKVITPHGYLVDLREDVFLPHLLKNGLPAGGVIDAEFQWCQNGSQLRLEVVGSDGHARYAQSWEIKQEAVTAARKARPKPQKVATKDLMPGQPYLFSSWGETETRIFLGRCRDHREPKKKLFAWMEIHSSSAGNPQAFLGRWREAVRNRRTFNVYVTTSSSAREPVGKPIQMPASWMSRTVWQKGDGARITDPTHYSFCT